MHEGGSERSGNEPEPFSEASGEVRDAELSPEEIARLPMPLAGWTADAGKLGIVLTQLRAAEREGRIARRVELARSINLSDATLSAYAKKWTNLGHAAPGTQKALIRVLEYFTWAQKNPELAYERYIKYAPLAPQRARTPSKKERAGAKLAYGNLSERQRRIGRVLARGLSGEAAAEAAVVTLETLRQDIEKAGGATHLVELIRIGPPAENKEGK